MLELVPALTTIFRTRQAIRVIKSLSLPNRRAKQLLSEWFNAHPKATGIGGSKWESYNVLLGREVNRLLRG